jgi:hypothetical protein
VSTADAYGPSARVSLRTDSRPTAMRPLDGAYTTAEPSQYAARRVCGTTRRAPLHGNILQMFSRSMPLNMTYLASLLGVRSLITTTHTHEPPCGLSLLVAHCKMRRQPHMLQRYAYVRVRGRKFTQNTTSQNLTQRHGCLAPMATFSASEPMT